MVITHSSSVLTDSDIEVAVAQGDLIRKDTFDRACLNQACYELRASKTYYDLNDGNRAITAKDGEEILIKPHHTVVIITEEHLLIPNDVIARIVSKGVLFSCGLMPVSTIADPGFMGNMGIVLHNVSELYVSFPVGQKIAKVDFTVIGQNVRGRYAGQHGYGTGAWIVKSEWIKNYNDVKNHSRMRSEVEETLSVVSPILRDGLITIFKYQRYLFLSMILLLLINYIAVAALNTDRLSFWVSVTTGILSNVGYGIMVWRATKVGGTLK